MAAWRMNEMFHQHIPVLLNEVLTHLITLPDGIYVDATFGRGNHSQAILNRLDTKGKLIAFDKDPEAVAYGRQHFAKDHRFSIVHSSFARMQMVLNELNVMGKINGILFDLGVSSPQLDDANRGFSFMREAKLDMRMDNSQGEDAKTWLAQVSEEELAHVIYVYGEEKYSRRIARAIVAARNEQPIVTTTQLAEVISRAVPKTKKWNPHEKHPATRSFQAIRIAINHELTEIEQGLNQALEALMVGGRLLVISFHSLEDRLVKQFIKKYEKGPTLPRGLPVKKTAFRSRLHSLIEPIQPNVHEIDVNPRARSAILRVAEKLS